MSAVVVCSSVLASCRCQGDGADGHETHFCICGGEWRGEEIIALPDISRGLGAYRWPDEVDQREGGDDGEARREAEGEEEVGGGGHGPGFPGSGSVGVSSLLEAPEGSSEGPSVSLPG